MKIFFAFLVCVTLIVTGCHFSNEAHYRITGVEAGSHSADRIKSIVRTAARKTGMTNEISSSLITNALASYGADGPHPVVLGAYFCDGNVMIDLQGEYGPHLPMFESAQRHLVPALIKEFGSSFETLSKHPTNACGPGFSVDVLTKP